MRFLMLCFTFLLSFNAFSAQGCFLFYPNAVEISPPFKNMKIRIARENAICFYYQLIQPQDKIICTLTNFNQGKLLYNAIAYQPSDSKHEPKPILNPIVLGTLTGSKTLILTQQDKKQITLDKAQKIYVPAEGVLIFTHDKNKHIDSALLTCAKTQ